MRVNSLTSRREAPRTLGGMAEAWLRKQGSSSAITQVGSTEDLTRLSLGSRAEELTNVLCGGGMNVLLGRKRGKLWPYGGGRFSQSKSIAPPGGHSRTAEASRRGPGYTASGANTRG